VVEPTLREYIETRLVVSGFAVDEAAEHAIKAWVRGMEPEEAWFIIGPMGDKYVAHQAGGRFRTKKMRDVMNFHLKQWCDQYKLGARS